MLTKEDWLGLGRTAVFSIAVIVAAIILATLLPDPGPNKVAPPKSVMTYDAMDQLVIGIEKELDNIDFDKDDLGVVKEKIEHIKKRITAAYLPTN